MKKINLFIWLTCTTMMIASCVKDYENPAEGVTNDKAALYVVRDAYHGSEVTLGADQLAGATFTTGTVISDKASGNIETGRFVIQSTTESANQIGDITRGIIIDLGAGTDVPYVVGDSLLINVDGAKMSRINGKLVISGVTTAKIEKLADSRPVYTKDVTLAMLNADFDKYESTLVAVHADVADFGAGVTFNGERTLDDNTSTATLVTRSEASFAADAVPVNAQFTGIVGYKNDNGNDTTGAEKILSLRSAADVNHVSGAIYDGFPEGFEVPDASEKASYNMTAIANNIDLATGNWKLQQALLGNTLIRDKYNLPGKQCVRMQQNLASSAYVQMNFDVTEGASKVTVFYGKYYTDPTSTFRLEYSINGGTNWVIVPGNITDMPDRGSKQATFIVDVPGNVRFRINKLGLGPSSATVFNGRLCIEDIAVYKKL
jgi:hypothetical protein